MSRLAEDDVIELPGLAAQENVNRHSMGISSPIHPITDPKPAMHQGTGSRLIHHDRDEQNHESNQDGEYAFLGGLRNLDEVAAPPPIQDRGEVQGLEYLENNRTRCRTRGQSPVPDWRSSLGSVNAPQGHALIPVETTMSDALDVEESRGNRRAPKFLMEMNTISSLVFFSFLGTLSRLVLEALTFYPGAPATIRVLWANFTGSLVLGFLSENCAVFRSDTGQAIVSSSDESELSWKAHEAAHKKSIPLYIGLTTGFCGCLTLFSTFLRDAFLAVANDIPSPIDGSSGITLYQPPSAAYQALNGGYSFMAFVAIILLEVGLSMVALHVGAHISISTANWLPTPSPIIDRLIVIAAPTTWLATICLVIWLPYFGREDNTLSRQTWPGPALYAFGVFPCRLCCQIDSTCRYA